MKLCIKCNANPQRGHNSYCKACHNEYQKSYYKQKPDSIRRSGRRRKDLIRQIIINAKTTPCCDCTKSYPYYVMDFDHVRETKTFNLSEAASKWRAIDTVEREIAKCDVVCANCHRERTFNRRSSSGRM